MPDSGSFRTISNVETLATATSILDIRVVELETFVQTLARVVELRPIKVRQALGVDQNLDTVRFKYRVIGFDDVEDASFAHPTLSTVCPGREQISREAVRLLRVRIAESAATPPVDRSPAQTIYADFRIMQRESSDRR